MVENVSAKRVPPELSALETASQHEDRYIQNYTNFLIISLHNKRRHKGKWGKWGKYFFPGQLFPYQPFLKIISKSE